MSFRKGTADGLVCLLLAAAVFAVFGQTAGFGFINLDDDEYVRENRVIQSGITVHGILAAFTQPHGVNWHPLTTLSHMLDCQLYGVRAGGHHLGNVALHALTAAVLYLVLRNMTGQAARSAFAAFFFALHPLRVESVVWVAERKDVLSGLFFALTLAAYLGYVRQPSSILRSLLVPCVFALGLMCKPMLVTVPFVLLLLDYWPLGRFAGWTSDNGNRSWWACARKFAGPILLEKLPLFILSGCCCAITLLVQASAMPGLRHLDLARRLENSLLAYAGYLKLLVWPSGLAIYYPYSEARPNPWSVMAAAVLLLAVSCAAWAWRRRRPYVLVGWLWYLGLLVPVIGLIQVGNQSMADRYTYLPLIGPVVAIVWFVADLAGESINRRIAFVTAGSLAVLAMALATARQTAFWRDDLTLWQRTLVCTKDNYFAHLHLGLAWAASGRNDKAVEQYEKALHILPEFAEARYDLACALSAQGKTDEAQREYETVLKIRPGYAKARNNLGMLLLNRGDYAAAAEQFQKALDADPNYALAHNNRGIALMAMGQYAAAAESYRRAIALDANLLLPHANLGFALEHMGRSSEAIKELRVFLDVQPDNPTVLAWLAATYAETGQYDAAVKTATAARDLAAASGQAAQAADIEKRIDAYRASRPFRE